MIQLTEKEYLDLVADRNKLWALEACGVDNWEGYDDAMQALEEEEDLSEEPEVGEPVEEEDFLSGVTCNPDAPEECESCQ
jgi:hypothetical protein